VIVGCNTAQGNMRQMPIVDAHQAFDLYISSLPRSLKFVVSVSGIGPVDPRQESLYNPGLGATGVSIEMKVHTRRASSLRAEK
jgi:hypothetical protein